MNAVADFGRRLRNVFREEALVDRPPRRAAIVGAKRAGRGDRDVYPLRVRGVEEDRVQAHAARAGLPFRSRAVLPQAGHLVPVLAAVSRLEERRVLDAGVHRVGIRQRRLEVPDALELPGMRRPVVPLMRTGHAVVGELVADRLPGFPAVARTLHRLSEPVARLRGVDAIGIGRRSFEVVDLPAGEEWTGDVPFLALAISTEDERAFAGADQNTYSTHKGTHHIGCRHVERVGRERQERRGAFYTESTSR